MNNPFILRLKSLQNYLAEKKIDVIMITSPTNIYYFTGFSSEPYERFMALIIDNRKDEAYLFVPSLDVYKAEKDSQIGSIIPVLDTDNPQKILRNKINPNIQWFGLEKKAISAFEYEKLKETFPKADYLDIEGFIMSLRSKKSPEEILAVKRAVEITEKVMEEGIKKVVPGMSESELTAELEYQMRVYGAHKPAFSTTVLAGRRSALPHGSSGQNKINKNDFLLIDMGVYINGYCSDLTRTFLMGDVLEEQEKIYDTVLAANLRAIEAVKVGDVISEVDRAARDHITSTGYGPFFNHRVGHGLGLDIHEQPSIHGSNSLIMEPGLLFTIEPGIYVPTIGGVRIEDDVYIDETGKVQVLTSFTKELIKL